MIKNCKYVGCITKKDVVRMIKELKKNISLHHNPVLMAYKNGDLWWYYLYLNDDILYYSILSTISKYGGTLLIEDNGFKIML